MVDTKHTAAPPKAPEAPPRTGIFSRTPKDESKPVEANKHEIKPEDRDYHVKSVRDLVQQLHNRNDQDANKVLDNMTKHLDALDGNPEAREAERLEAEQVKAATEKREKAKADADKAKPEGEKVA